MFSSLMSCQYKLECFSSLQSQIEKVLLWLLFDIVINCLVGLTPFVDNFTHLGGMVYGFLCGLSTIERLSTDFFGIATSFWTKLRNILLRFSGLIISVVLIMITTAVLVDTDVGKSPCPSCRYVSCVPFPPWAGEDNKVSEVDSVQWSQLTL